MGGFYNSNNADIADRGYVSSTVSVGTSEVEAKVGGSRLAERQFLTIYNDSSNTVYYGPTGVTTTGSTKGIPIEKSQFVSIPVGEDLAVFLIAGSASNSVIVQEWA